MVKAFAASALGLGLFFGVCGSLLGSLVFVGCSSSPDSTFPGDPPKPDAEPDAPGALFPEGGGPDSGGEGGPGMCTPKTPSPFTPVWKAPVKAPGACSAQQLKDYYNACLVNPTATETDGTCANWKKDAANVTCATCTEPDDQGGPIQWHLTRQFYTLNVAGCINLKQDGTDAGAAGCGEAYNAALDCERQSCLTCISEAKSFTLFSACQAETKTKGCMTYETMKTSACGSYTGAGACFPNSTEKTELQGTGLSETFYTRVLGVTCGP